MRLVAALRGAGGRVVDLILPPRCLGCGATVADVGTLCGACWSAVRFIGGGACDRCGVPFGHEVPGRTVCAACAAAPPAFARARAVMVYDAATRPMLLRFKHADRTDAAPGFAAWMARAGADLVAEADLIAPVPLHRWRLAARRFNQAALLAGRLGRLAGKPVAPDLLTRRRATPSQGRMGRLARARNVAGAFAVRPAWASTLAGRRVLLVDDVLTTGATVGECAKVLRRAGASAVDVLTLARVTLEESGDGAGDGANRIL
jgi:ComF family protein